MREIKFRAWNKEFSKMKITGFGINKGILDGENVIIMQYTGFKDKNRNEIYEGDIVKCDWSSQNDEVVYFSHGFFRKHIQNRIESLTPLDDRCKLYKIIGNIYENPELIGGK